MPKVKLTEQQLRDVILAALNEAAPADDAAPASTDAGGTDSTTSFYAQFRPTRVMLGSVQYLIDANNALDKSSDIIIQPGVSYKITIKDMRDEVYESAATGNLSLGWDESTAAVDSAVIYKAWLKLQIIKTIEDPKVVGRKFFHVGDTAYSTQAMFANPGIIAYNTISNPTRVNVGSKQFFDMLDKEDFVNEISSGESQTPDVQYVPTLDPGIAYVNAAAAEPIKLKAMAEAERAVAAMKAVWDQFNTDFVEEYFCLPVILPNGVWKRASNTGDPRSTPWRMSYGVYNIAAQAVGVRGGVAALYRKLFSYSKAGPQVQMLGRTKKGDPFITSGLFRESLESRKALITASDLRRVIQAALGVNLNGRSYSDIRLNENFASWFKRLIGWGEELSPLEKLAAKRIASATSGAEVDELARSLVNLFGSLGFDPDAAKGMIKSFIAPGSVLPPQAQMRFPKAVDKVDQDDLYSLLSTLLTEMSSGEVIENTIVKLTASGAFSAGEIASLGQVKRETLLRMIRQAKEQGGFLTGQNTAKQDFLASLTRTVQENFLQSFKATKTTGSGSSRINRELTYDTASKQFILTGASRTPTGALRSAPISEATARSIFGDDVVNPAVDVINGNIPSASGDKVSILESFRGFQEAQLALAEDALIGMLSNPTRANRTARKGAAALDATRFDVGLEAIPSTSSSLGSFTEEAQGLFGKYIINPKGRAFFKNLTFVERNFIGGPIRGAARLVRNAFAGKGMLADIADAIATNGVYSYLLGFLVYNAVLLGTPDVKSTPGQEESTFGVLISTLSSVMNTSPVVPALANFAIDIFGKAFDAVLQSEDENIQALFNADLLLSSEENLATALVTFSNIIDVRPENFPALIRDPNEAAAKAAQAAAAAAAAVQNGTIALTSGNQAAANAGVKQLTQNVAAVAAVIGTGGSTSGNDAWANLEASRKDVSGMTIDAVKATSSGLVGTIPNIAPNAGTMTTDYKTTTAGEDFWLRLGTALVKTTTGRDVSKSMEAWAWLKIASGEGLAPSTGSDFASYLADEGIAVNADSLTIQQVNTEFEKLAGILKKQTEAPPTGEKSTTWSAEP